MSNGLDAFKKRAPGKFAKFLQPGATAAGVITEISDQKQATKFNRDPKAKRELDFWPSGDPVMEVWITLQTQERDPQDPEDTGLRVVVVTVNQKAGGQLAAIMDACEAVGAETPLPGGFLAITFTGFDPNSENAQNPRKLYAANYQAPAPGGGAFQQPPVQQQPQYNEWNPAPPQQHVPQAQPIQQQPPVPASAYAAPAAAPPAWAQQPAQQQYQPPVQVNTATGEIGGQQQPPVQQFQQPPVQQVPQAQPVQQQPPVQQAPAQQGGGVDAVQIQSLIAQGMDDNTINQATGAPHAAIAAIRGIS